MTDVERGREAEAVRAQLQRRAGSVGAPSGAEGGVSDRGRRLATAIAVVVAGEEQVGGRPWDRLRQPQVLRPVVNRTPVFAAVAVSWTVVVALVVAVLPGYLAPPPTTSPAGATDWYLTNDQLVRVVRDAATSNANVGKTVVANVQITELAQSCAQAGSCGYDIFLSGIEPRIPVTGADLPSCPTPLACSGALPPPGPTALTIESGSVKFIAALTTRGLASDRIAFSVAEALLDRPLGDFVVSGWLWNIGSPPCAAPLQPEAGPDFGCGQATWLTDTAPSAPVAPLTGLRVQNGAMAGIEAPANAEGSGDLQSVEGRYLLSDVPTPPQCVQCASGIARLVMPIDTVSIPPASTPPPAQPTDPTASVAGPPVTPAPIATTGPSAAAANANADKFEQFRATGQWTQAWAFLGPATRSVFGSEASFASGEAAYNATGGTVYDVAAPARNADLISEANLGAAVWAEIEPPTAWYVTVTHPRVNGASAGFEGLLVASGTDGAIHVWIVH